MRPLKVEEMAGGKVTFAFRMGTRWLRHGTLLTHEELANLPIRNRQALIEKGYIFVWPKVANEIQTAGPAANGDEPSVPPHPPSRFVINRGFGHFDVVEGKKLNDGALNKEQALAMAG